MTDTEHNVDSKDLTVEDIRELHTEDGDIEVYAKGHWEAKHFATVVGQYLVDQYEDWYQLPSEQSVTWGWARMVPIMDSHGMIFWPVSKVKSMRGVFAYTIIREVEAHD